MTDRAAVVIGVDQTGGLARLESPSRSANEVAKWLGIEGYDVALVTDESGPAHAEQVRVALEGFVTQPPKYRLLVIYFSGHGYWHARSDRWLFSGAPTNGADAINLKGAMDLARNSGIETVVFISDACRSIPDAEGQRVEGIDALPNVNYETPSKVDSIKATSLATAAYEAKIPTAAGGTGEHESVLTKAFRLAYEKPTPDMVTTASVNGVTVNVVTNRRLEDFLQDKVDDLLGAAAPGNQQTLVIEVPSRDDVYIAKAASTVEAPPRPRSPATDVGRTTAAALREAYHRGAAVTPLNDPESEAAVERAMPRHGVKDSFETQCGFLVWGAAVESAAATHGATAEVDTEGDASDIPGIVRMYLSTAGASVGIQLSDGRSFVVPALQGYIGHVTLDELGVAGVSYIPSQGSDRYAEYEYRQPEIDRLRALVEVSVDLGRFRVTEDDAANLAAIIRVGKAFDPTLGVYAAHAYSAAGLDQQVEDVLHYMAEDLGISVFDVMVLASRRIDASDWPSVPFCPVLTQTWNLLRPRGIELPGALEELRPKLQNSLWNTFAPNAAGILVESIERGELT